MGSRVTGWRLNEIQDVGVQNWQGMRFFFTLRIHRSQDDTWPSACVSSTSAAQTRLVAMARVDLQPHRSKMPASSRPFSPRWVSLLQDSLNTSTAKDPSQIAYALSSSSASGPRVRMVVHRGFVNERRPNEDPNWSENPAVDSEGRGLVTDGLLLTTDIRCAPSGLRRGKTRLTQV